MPFFPPSQHHQQPHHSHQELPPFDSKALKLVRDYGINSTSLSFLNSFNFTNHSSSAFIKNKRLAKLAIQNEIKKHNKWKIHRIVKSHKGWVRAAAYHPQDSLLCSGSNDRTLILWDPETGKRKLTLTKHLSSVTDIVWHPNNYKHLISSGEDKAIYLWDLNLNRAIRNFHGHFSSIYCLDFYNESNILLSGGRDCSIKIWDCRMGSKSSQNHTIGGHTGAVTDLCILQGQKQFFSSSQDKSIRFWDLRTLKCIKTAIYHSSGVRSLVAKDNILTSASFDSIRQWNIKDFSPLRVIKNQENQLIESCDVNSNGVFVVGASDGEIGFYDYFTGTQYHQTRSKKLEKSELGIQKVLFNHKGNQLITCEIDHTIKFWKQEDTDVGISK